MYWRKDWLNEDEEWNFESVKAERAPSSAIKLVYFSLFYPNTFT